MKRLILTMAALITTLNLAQPVKAAALPEPIATALQKAYADEVHAETFYAAVIKKFGPVRPFSNIIDAERRHQSMLQGLFARYQIQAKAQPASDSPVPETLKEACQEGVKAEIANRDLYDKELLPAVKDYPDLVEVFTRLRDASQNNHLPAFERCASRR